MPTLSIMHPGHYYDDDNGLKQDKGGVGVKENKRKPFSGEKPPSSPLLGLDSWTRWFLRSWWYHKTKLFFNDETNLSIVNLVISIQRFATLPAMVRTWSWETVGRRWSCFPIKCFLKPIIMMMIRGWWWWWSGSSPRRGPLSSLVCSERAEGRHGGWNIVIIVFIVIMASSWYKATFRQIKSFHPHC